MQRTGVAAWTGTERAFCDDWADPTRAVSNREPHNQKTETQTEWPFKHRLNDVIIFSPPVAQGSSPSAIGSWPKGVYR
jgi:hypothetical protein